MRIKTSKKIVAAALAVSLAMVPFVQAAPQLSHVFGHSKSNTDMSASQDALVKDFVGSQKEVLTAQALLSRAYGMKDQAEQLEAEQKALSSGSVDESSLKKTVEISKAANKKIAEKQAKQVKLNAEEKKAYSASLPHFAKGVLGTRKTVQEAEKFASSVKSSAGGGLAGLASGFGKLKEGLYIAKATPGYSKELYTVFKKTVMIGKKNGVTVPANATDALGGLGE
ncbi:hypothetical protein [Oleiagrimonas sp. MCCC 1A03011]|uniref:hypothetical protein n=1 Tax=Oleiagrimonas sp. MCCC 1A03011 TaxID=1926883 RepID=UPI000DC51B47|nr:hypothetical protein [Oleiagrimonas sp. MCCC 1A03011]RAP58105.1 hypothetical protein BTJ49_03695 [Oleiagrimonas sp. MCCC 1A03011]